MKLFTKHAWVWPLFFSGALALGQRPQVTIAIIIDQFAAHYIPKLSPFFNYAFKELLTNGIVYQNANHPHSMPSTGPGHAALSSGCYPKDHGIVANNWCDPQGNSVACDDDHPACAAVINPVTGRSYHFGKGPVHIMTDTLSDQFALRNQPDTPRDVFSISLKSRSAICSANKMGKALWLDGKTGQFTSSKAYFDQLPGWIRQFNRAHGAQNLRSVSWPVFFDKESPAYNFKNINNYSFSSRGPIAGTTITINRQEKHPWSTFELTPAANQLVLDCAAYCIKHQLEKNSSQELLVWVCLSSLDMVGHIYGPQSREAIDMIYHLDYQIHQFMKTVSSLIDSQKVLYVLSGDHGVSPIPELLEQEGYAPAQRINYADLIPVLNQKIHEQIGVQELIHDCMSAQLFVKDSTWNKLTSEQQQESLDTIKKIVGAHPGVKTIWTTQELKARAFHPHQIEFFYQNQIYPGRTGKLIVQPLPYCVIDSHQLGTGHRTPYEADTHVPLILYQKNELKPEKITKNVWTLQLAPTLAELLEVPRPSACVMEILPGITKQSNIHIKGETHEKAVISNSCDVRNECERGVPIVQCAPIQTCTKKKQLSTGKNN